jgi:hypothetical protein
MHLRVVPGELWRYPPRFVERGDCPFMVTM